MPKRLCPFNENFPQLKMHIDMRNVGKEDYKAEVYEKTMQLMKAGAVQARKEELNRTNKDDLSKGKMNIGPVFKVLKEKSGCYYCRLGSSNSLTSCQYCNKNMCSNKCSKTCSFCGFLFCPSCCSMNYDVYEERVLCISCSDTDGMYS